MRDICRHMRDICLCSGESLKMPSKLGDPAGCHYLVTTLTFYYSSVTDLTLSRSVHATELEPCCPDPFLLSSSECRAIHYGQCSSLLKLPTFAIVPPNCKVEGKVVNPRTAVPKQEETILGLSLGTSRIARSSRSESPEKDTCSALDLLAANIEQNIKPFLSILSSCETTNWSDTNQDESISDLASSLQYHLGNFITAVRHQQQVSKDECEASEETKGSIPSELLYSSKSDFPVKIASAPYNDNLYANENSLIHNNNDTIENDWPSSSLYMLNSVATHSKSHTNLEEIPVDERKDRLLDSCERKKDRFVNKGTTEGSSETKSSYLHSSDASLAKQREVLRILNKTDSVKNTLYSSNTNSVDSELLDSLISLMNVSLVDLEDSSQKQNNNKQGEIQVPNAKPRHRFESRTSYATLEDCNFGDPDISVNKEPKKRDDDNVQPPPCRKKLIFDSEGSIESNALPKAHESTIVKTGKQNMANGELREIPNKVSNHEDWSISSFHRRDSLVPIPPSDFHAKRLYTSSRINSATDHHQAISTPKSSVAERVLAFEKCPDWNVERSGSLKEFNRKANKEKEYFPVLPKKIKLSNRSALPENSGVQFVRKASQIPKFHFPNGLPTSPENLGAQLELLKSTFSSSKGKVTYETFHVITKACSLPLYWKMPLYLAVGTDKLKYVTTNKFLDFWKRMTSVYHDDPSRFVYILSRGKRSFLLPEDFRPMIQDIVDTHPGLTFLRDSKEFHSRYVDTVISRIFYDVNRSWSGKVTALELRKSNFLQAVAELEEDDDINQMTDYFSYEHFYVIYCKFWKIDTDHDLLIDKCDMRHHNNGDISSRMIDRIFSGAVSREMMKTSHMRYTDFVWFLLAEEDKRHSRSIEYWFRCMDLNGDGFLSMYELEYFYDEQARRMVAAGLEAMPFKDCLCQMLDMVRPKTPEKISLSDLKHCKLTTLFFDTFFNFGKHLEHEQKDPFSSVKFADGQTPEISDWCRYAEDEYSHLISEENYGYSDRYQGAGQYYCADNAAFAKPEFVSRMYSKSSDRDDDDDYADSDADY